MLFFNDGFLYFYASINSLYHLRIKIRKSIMKKIFILVLLITLTNLHSQDANAQTASPSSVSEEEEEQECPSLSISYHLGLSWLILSRVALAYFSNETKRK